MILIAKAKHKKSVDLPSPREGSSCPQKHKRMEKKSNHIPDPLAHHCWLLLMVSRQLSEERRQQYRPSFSLACDEFFFFSKGDLEVVSLERVSKGREMMMRAMHSYSS